MDARVSSLRKSYDFRYSPVPQWKRVAVVGVGLIGGSIGLALRERKLGGEVVGIGRRTAGLNRAKKAGAIDRGTTNLEAGVAGADVIVVCTPVGEIARQVLEIAQLAVGEYTGGKDDKSKGGKPLITDAGSTKAGIVAAVEKKLPLGTRFVGSHPLAGSEKCGVEFARADLFEGRAVVVTPTKRTAPDDVQDVADFWSGLGASVVCMSPDEHDAALAGTSHLPHLVAAALAGITNSEDLPLAASGWRDTTRIAAGDAELWTQILLENRGHVLKSLARFETTMKAFRAALKNKDRQQLNHLLTEGKQVRDAVGN